MRLFVAAAAALLLLAAPAGAQTYDIDGSPLDVELGLYSDLNANFDAGSGWTTADFFYLDNRAGLFVRLADGRVFWPSSDFGTRYIPTFDGDTGFPPPTTGSGTSADPYVAQRDYYARSGSQTLFRVHQTTRYVNGETRFRQTYEITNATPAPLAFRAMVGGDLRVDGGDTGVGAFVDGVPRFVGGENDAGTVVGGVEEVRWSQLPGEATGTPIPAWADWEVTTPGYGDGLWGRIESPGGFTRSILDAPLDNAVGVEWTDHEIPAKALAPGATARYEVVWRVRQPRELRLTRKVGAADTGSPYHLTATLRDRLDRPFAGRTIRWRTTGAHSRSGTVTTDALGHADIAWTEATPGVDEVFAWHDADGDGSSGPEEGDAQATATVDWHPASEVDPPAIAPKFAPNGRRVPFHVQIDPARPNEREFTFFREEINGVGGFPACAGGGMLLNIDYTVNVKPEGAVVKDGAAQLVVLDRANPEGAPLQVFDQVGPATADGDYTFRLDCVRSGLLQLRFTRVQSSPSGEREVDWPLGGMVLIDPRGIVHDGNRYDCLAAAGASPADARAGSAVPGAAVRLQRKVGDAFVTVPAGDPGIAPNVNPQATDATGLYAWDVAAGFYRVVVAAPGYPETTSRVVEVPPPVLDLHVGLRGAGFGGCGTQPAGPGPAGPAVPGAPGGGPERPGTATAALSLKGTKARQKLKDARRRGVAVTARPTVAGRLTLALHKGKRKLKSLSRSVVPGKTVKVRVKAARKRLRKGRYELRATLRPATGGAAVRARVKVRLR